MQSAMTCRTDTCYYKILREALDWAIIRNNIPTEIAVSETLIPNTELLPVHYLCVLLLNLIYSLPQSRICTSLFRWKALVVRSWNDEQWNTITYESSEIPSSYKFFYTCILLPTFLQIHCAHLALSFPFAVAFYEPFQQFKICKILKFSYINCGFERHFKH